MPRYKLIIEYDGTGFVGWQRQDNGLSVQQAIEEAVEKLCQQQVTVHGAGRTDSGVHALGQVAHVDLPKDYGADKVRDALNQLLKPQAVCILETEEVKPGFHARFSATGRAYLYRILNRRPPPVLDAGRVWHVPVPLDVALMQEAARELVGSHDFTSFRASQCQAESAERTLDVLEISRCGEEVHIRAEARSFLHHMVRNMTGTLERVGAGRWPVAEVRRALEAKDRKAAGPTAPPQGLYLTKVVY